MKKARLSLFSFAVTVGILWLGNARAHDDPANTITALSQHILESPDDPELYIRRGKLYRLASSWEPALHDFNRAAELIEKTQEEYPVDLNFYIGASLLGAGEPEMALKHLNKSVEQYPSGSEALVIRADAYASLGSFQIAAMDLARAIELADHPQPGMYLKLAGLHVASDDTDAALATIDAGIKKLGAAISLIQFAFEIELESGNYDAALLRIDQLPGSLRKTPNWLVRRGDTLLLADNPRAALANYQHAQQAIIEMPALRRTTIAMLELQKKIDLKVALLK